MSKFYFSDFIKGNPKFFDSFGKNIHQVSVAKTKADKIQEIKDRQEVVQEFIDDYGLMPEDLDGIRDSDLSNTQKQRLFQTLYLLSSQATLGVEAAQKTVISSFLLSDDIKPYLAGIDLSRTEETSQNLANGVFVKSGLEKTISNLNEINSIEATIEKSFGFKGAFKGVIERGEILSSKEALEHILSSDIEADPLQAPVKEHLEQFLSTNPSASVDEALASIDEYISIQNNALKSNLNQTFKATGLSSKEELIATLAFVQKSLPEEEDPQTTFIKKRLNKVIPEGTEPKEYTDFAFLDGVSSFTEGAMNDVGVISGKIERKDLFDVSSRDFESEVNKILSENKFSIVKKVKFGENISPKTHNEAILTNALAQEREAAFNKSSIQEQENFIDKNLKQQSDEQIAREKAEEIRKMSQPLQADGNASEVGDIKLSTDDVKVESVQQDKPNPEIIAPENAGQDISVNEQKLGKLVDDELSINPDGITDSPRVTSNSNEKPDLNDKGILSSLKDAAITAMEYAQSGQAKVKQVLESNESVIKNDKGKDLLNLKSGGALAKIIGKENNSLRATFKRSGFDNPEVHKVAALKVKQAGVKNPFIVLPTAKDISQEQRLEFFKNAYRSLREAGFDADSISNSLSNKALRHQIKAAKEEIEKQIIADEINRVAEFGGILNEVESELLQHDEPSLTEDELNTLNDIHPLESEGVELAEGINPEEAAENNIENDIAIAEGVNPESTELNEANEVSGFAYDSDKSADIKSALEQEPNKDGDLDNKRALKVSRKM